MKYDFDRQAQEKGQKRPREWISVEYGTFRDTLVSVMSASATDIIHGIFRCLQSKTVYVPIL